MYLLDSVDSLFRRSGQSWNDLADYFPLTAWSTRFHVTQISTQVPWYRLRSRLWWPCPLTGQYWQALWESQILTFSTVHESGSSKQVMDDIVFDSDCSLLLIWWNLLHFRFQMVLCSWQWACWVASPDGNIDELFDRRVLFHMGNQFEVEIATKDWFICIWCNPWLHLENDKRVVSQPRSWSQDRSQRS